MTRKNAKPHKMKSKRRGESDTLKFIKMYGDADRPFAYCFNTNEHNGLFEITDYWHTKGKVAFTNGCFDIIHAGHIKLISWIDTTLLDPGDRLIIGLNSDESIRKLKGSNRPINNLQDRITVLSQLRGVDAIVVFNEPTPLKLIKRIKPNWLVKGGEYEVDEIVGSKFVQNYGGWVSRYAYPGHSTTNIIEKAGKIWQNAQNAAKPVHS